jgi:hypothetical protein
MLSICIGAAQNGQHSERDFLNGNLLHAPEIDRTFAQEARAAFDLMTNHAMDVSKRAG